MTPVKSDPVEARTRELLEREDQDRAERAREIAAQEIELELRAQEEANAIETSRQRLRAMNRKDIDAARETAAAALDAYAAAIAAWNAELASIRETLSLPWRSTLPAGVFFFTTGGVEVGDIKVSAAGPQRLMAELVTETIHKHEPRALIDLNYPPD